MPDNMKSMHFDWADLAFGSKKPLSSLNAVFVAAPREVSRPWLRNLLQNHLPSSNIVIGIAKEDYVDGFEGQPQFKTLKTKALLDIVASVHRSTLKNKVYILSYFQRELPYILEKVNFDMALFVNGSWQYAFHTSPIFYTIVNRQLLYDLISPFVDETEAQAEAKRLESAVKRSLDLTTTGTISELAVMQLANQAAKQSFDYNFQTGTVLGKRVGNKYRVVDTAFNKVVPYQTYAMHHGASRETNFSPPQDLNFYDTVHAEVALIIQAQKNKTSLKGAALFINLLPCPTCSRMLAETDIAEIVYREDHSDGYAVQLLEAAGKKVRRLVA